MVKVDADVTKLKCPMDTNSSLLSFDKWISQRSRIVLFEFFSTQYNFSYLWFFKLGN